MSEGSAWTERREIVRLWRAGAAGVLVLLARVEGSSYRRPGARLLTSAGPAGSYAGTVSGGCLESDVVRRAAWLVAEGAVVERYSLAFDDTAEIPFGLGCGGTVELLLEPVGTPEAEALLLAMELSLAGHASTVVTFLPGGGRPLRRLILDGAGAIVFASPQLSPDKIACARRLDPAAEHEGRCIEQLGPPQRLIVLGAGDDARPVVRLGALLGWTVLVGDGRSQLARAERFPEAEQVLTVQSAGELGIGPEDAVVVMTHSYEQDRALLVSALPLRPRYLGLLGSRHRSSLLVSEAAAMLGRTVESCCEGLFAPVGMDLGGDGPEAIALSIVAEVQALVQGRLGHSRRLTPAEIERQLEQGGASHYLQARCALSDA